jgi:hypothetical protein
MGRKSNHLMERVYAHLSKNGCRKSGFLADPAQCLNCFQKSVIFVSKLVIFPQNEEFGSIFLEKKVVL